MLHNVYQFHVAPKQLCKGGIDHCSPECAWDPLYPGEPELFNHSVAPWATALKLLARSGSKAPRFHGQPVSRCFMLKGHPPTTVSNISKQWHGAEVFCIRFWMQAFGAPAIKPSMILTNQPLFWTLSRKRVLKAIRKRSSTTTKRYRDSKGQNGFSFTKQLKQSQNLASFEYFTCSSWWHLHILCCTFMLHGLKFILTSRFPQHEALGIDGNGLI